MKTTTTTREYDDEGRMVRETITEQDHTPTPVAAHCTCAWARYATGWCPVHGFTGPTAITTTYKPNSSYTVCNIDGAAVARTITSILNS